MNSQSTPFLKTAKLWARSKSLRFARNLPLTDAEHSIDSFHWNGQKLFYRPGTGDADILHRILLKPDAKKEYHFPLDLNPTLILDIGANIGAATLLLRHCYPKAKIVAFEPEPKNFEILKLNTSSDKNIEVHCFGLGSEDREADLYLEDDSQNLGGFSLKRFGIEVKSKSKVQIRNAGKALLALGIHSADLIKIDTEGAENEIVNSLEAGFLEKVKWICGELHGVNDFELLQTLSGSFEIGIRKSWWNRLAHFEACRKDIKLSPF